MIARSMRMLDGQRPEISYPCPWSYRIICTDEDALRGAIVGIVGESTHTLAHVGDSPTGHYHRLELVVQVRDEPHRNEIYAALGRVPVVRFVL